MVIAFSRERSEWEKVAEGRMRALQSQIHLSMSVRHGFTGSESGFPVLIPVSQT
jgi:hypothetical protein